MAYSSIAKPTDYFNTVLYTGNAADGSSTTQDITGAGFQPDWVWIKGRDNANSNFVNDAVRGSNKALITDGTNAEITSTEYLKSFASDGFQVGGDGIGNGNGNTYVSWNWKANGSGSSNSDGSITSTVSANTTAGFSIVSYTGTGATATIGHGLGSAPKWVIVKQRDNTRNWVVMHQGIGFTKYLYLDSNQASNTGNFFNDTDPSSTVFNVVNDSGVNGSSGSYIAYCFAEKKGFSKFGSFTGNGNADGPFVYTGFKPAFVITKTASAAYHWSTNDNKRNTFNPVDKRLYPSQSAVEATSDSYDVDFLSNGFKIRSSSVSFNNSGDNVIYMAFAENPFVGNDSGTAVPVTAG